MAPSHKLQLSSTSSALLRGGTAWVLRMAGRREDGAGTRPPGGAGVHEPASCLRAWMDRGASCPQPRSRWSAGVLSADEPQQVGAEAVLS